MTAMKTGIVQSLEGDERSSSGYHVASVVLNFNSDSDLFISVPQLATQKGVTHSLIIVDNASDESCIRRITSWLDTWRADAVIGTTREIEEWVIKNKEDARRGGQVFLVLNEVNAGYSAGNNVGIRIADLLDADATLIANPDMRIMNPNYLLELTNQLFIDPKSFVAGSRILGLDGEEQSPLREPSFWEELFWPRFYLSRFLKPITYVLPISSDDPIAVPKVSGCCLLLRMSYLKSIGYLDEGVFLYCEEPILASRVHRDGGCIMFVPSLAAVHSHIRSEKSNSSQRMLIFIKSRKYYLERYSGYNLLQRILLAGSYATLTTLHMIKLYIARLRRQRV